MDCTIYSVLKLYNQFIKILIDHGFIGFYLSSKWDGPVGIYAIVAVIEHQLCTVVYHPDHKDKTIYDLEELDDYITLLRVFHE